MEYSREDYRTLYNDRENGTWSDLSTTQKVCVVLLAMAVLATGLNGAEQETVMPQGAKAMCPPYDADGRKLVSSMVHATYIKGAPEPHECHYGSRG